MCSAYPTQPPCSLPAGTTALSCSAACSCTWFPVHLLQPTPLRVAAGASAAQLWCCLQLHEGGGEQAVQVISHQSAAVPTQWGQRHVAIQHLSAHFCRLWAPATQGDLALSVLWCGGVRYCAPSKHGGLALRSLQPGSCCAWRASLTGHCVNSSGDLLTKGAVPCTVQGFGLAWRSARASRPCYPTGFSLQIVL